MAAESNGKPIKVELDRDGDGHRTYKVTYIVTSLVTDGPFAVLNAAGLPATGAVWSNAAAHEWATDTDSWAFCLPTCSVRPVRQGQQPARVWHVEKTFTTRPIKRCQDDSIEDPLLEPPRISGGFSKFIEEAQIDRHGDPIVSSSHERLTGPLLDKDNNRPTVRIEMNVADLNLDVFSEMIDTVNDAPLWGLDARMIKLSDAPWEQKFYGTCSVYYTISYEFEIDRQTFDRDVLDEGTLELMPGGSPWNPKHFKAIKEDLGENRKAILDGSGNVWDGSGSPGKIRVEKYSESNFLLLGIPTSL
jgi:hypothetical protein